VTNDANSLAREQGPDALREAIDHGTPVVDLASMRGAPSNTKEPRPRPLDIGEFLQLKIPPRRKILTPWLLEKSITMIYSWRGIGKTRLVLSIGYSVATGSGMLNWESTEGPRKVLYVDGELPADELQQRLAITIGGVEKEPPSTEYFRIWSSDLLTDRGLPDLATRAGQHEFDAHIGDAEVVILDSISTLCRQGEENAAESWVGIQEWALTQRRAGRSVIFLHHSGKDGLQRGTSKREDVLDTVIGLRRPQDYSADQGARFELHYEKARGFHGPDAEAFLAQYEERDGAALWTRRAMTDAELKRVIDALNDGMSIRGAAQALDINKSKVERLRTKAQEQGLI
jgi:putative DNA primase/helicase